MAPFIDDRHINIIYKHCHLSTSRRAICTPHSLINIALNSSLQWGMWKKVKLKRKNCSTIPLHLLIYKQDQISFIMNCYLYPSPLHQILSKKKMLQSNTYIFYWKHVGRLWCPELIPDIEKFLPVSIFKMATSIPQKFNIVRFQR
jgi:hypothetical protein